MTAVFRLGWPIGVTGLAESGLFQATALMMGWIGTVELAAHGIAMEVTALSFMVHLGLSNAATVRAGRADGAGEARHLRDGAKVAIGLSLLFGISMVTLFLVLPGPDHRVVSGSRQTLQRRDCGLWHRPSGDCSTVSAGRCDAGHGAGPVAGHPRHPVPMIAATVSYWLIGIPVQLCAGIPLWNGRYRSLAWPCGRADLCRIPSDDPLLDAGAQSLADFFCSKYPGGKPAGRRGAGPPSSRSFFTRDPRLSTAVPPFCAPEPIADHASPAAAHP